MDSTARCRVWLSGTGTVMTSPDLVTQTSTFSATRFALFRSMASRRRAASSSRETPACSKRICLRFLLSEGNLAPLSLWVTIVGRGTFQYRFPQLPYLRGGQELVVVELITIQIDLILLTEEDQLPRSHPKDVPGSAQIIQPFPVHLVVLTYGTADCGGYIIDDLLNRQMGQRR
jgi:hypothetical protein